MCVPVDSVSGMLKIEILLYCIFNCIFSESKAAIVHVTLKWPLIALLRSHCLPFMHYAAEAISLSSVNIRMLDSYNRARYRIFGAACDRSGLESYIKI